jgi:RND family efflux transporter MFP subunit
MLKVLTIKPHNKMMHRQTLTHWFLLGLLGSPIATKVCPAADSSANLDRVTAALPIVKTLTLTTTQPGHLTAYEETSIASKLSGYVEAVFVDIGTEVKKDQILIRLSIPEMNDELLQREASLLQAQAEIGQAKSTVESVRAAAATAEAAIEEATAGKGRVEAELEKIRSEADRIRRLAKSGAVTEKLVDEVNNQLKSAEAACVEIDARVKSAEAGFKQARSLIEKAQADVYAAEAKARVAQANLSLLKTMMNYREIKAPYAGVITQRLVDTGSFVQPASDQSKPLLVMARTDLLRVRVDVPEMEAGFVDSGENGDDASITIQALAKPAIKSKVIRSSWSLDASNRSLRTEMELPNPEKILRPGMFAYVVITLDKRTDVVALPITAVYKKESGSYVCAVVDGKIAHRAVELGLKVGGEIEIRSGVTPTDSIVTIRGEALTDGQAVSVVIPAPTAK